MIRAAIAPRLLGRGAVAALRARVAHISNNAATPGIFSSGVEISTVLAVGGLPC